MQVKVPVCVFAFDCLFVDGQSLLKRPLQERRERLAAALPNLRPGFVCLAHSHVLQAPAEAAPEHAQLATAPDATAASPQTSQQAVVPPAMPGRPAARQPSDLSPDGVAMEVDAPDKHVTIAVSVSQEPCDPLTSCPNLSEPLWLDRQHRWLLPHEICTLTEVG